MTEWTSISVTTEQKELIESYKPDGMTMGKYLVECVEGDGVIATHEGPSHDDIRVACEEACRAAIEEYGGR
jgi:hypothetical protein